MYAVLMALVLSTDTLIEGAGIVRATVDGLTGSEGTLMILLFDGEAGLPPDAEKVFASDCVEVADSILTIAFLGVPYGEYAMIAFRDLDGDCRPDISGSGFSEPFCYSMQTGPGGGIPASSGEVPSGDPPSGSSAHREVMLPGTAEVTFDMISFEHSGSETSVRMTMTGVGAIGRPAGGDDMPPGGPGGPPPGGGGTGFR
jgi:uncharacterized protein (DUF2141 family)